jgi:hypothetical protein
MIDIIIFVYASVHMLATPTRLDTVNMSQLDLVIF